MSEFPPTPAPVVEPGVEMSEEERYRLVLIDQSHDARDQARDLADVQLTEELNEGGWLRRAVKGVWKGNLLKDYYRLKYTRQHEAKISESNDVLQGESLPEAQTRSINALVSRFQSDEDELIHTDAGEKREVHTDDTLSNGLKDIIRRFTVEKTLNETTLEQEKKKLLEEYGKQNPDADLSKSLVLTDNLLEVAQSIKGRFTHDEAMERAIASMEIITGQARNGARTEAQYSKADVIANYLSKTKAGSLVTPGALATGIALGLSAAGVGTKSVVGAAAATVGLGSVAGVWAGLRENKRVKDERSQHSREMATGGGFDEGGEESKGDKRRIEMEATRYQSVSALELTNELLSKTSIEALEVGENQNEAVRAALEALARAQARIDLSDTKNIDLIHYSSKADVGEERIKLDLARIESRKALANALTPELRAELGLNEELGVKDIIAGHVELYKDEIETDMSEKDKAFRALKRRRVARAAVIGTTVGIAGGLVAQEAMAAIDPSRFGIFEALSGASAPIGADGEVHQTILTSFVNGDSTVEHVDASSTFDQHDSTAESFVKTGDDMEWNKNDDGTFTLVGPDGKTAVEDIVVNPDGSMDQPTIDRIEEAGLNVKDDTWIDPVESTVTKEVSLDQYWQENAGEMQSTSIDTWYMNNSPNPDLNEIRLYRGGDNGLIDGGFRFESGMTPDGSFVNGESVNPVEAAQQGNMVWVVSKMGEDSGAMFTIPAGPDGSLTIMKDDPAGALFSDVNGRAELAQGYRLHAFYSEGVDANGTLRGGSLATMVGEAEVSTTTQTETVVNDVVHHEYKISSNGYDIAHDNITEVAPITPIVGRKSMETLSRQTAEATPVPFAAPVAEQPSTPEQNSESAAYGYGEITAETLEGWQRDISPRLRAEQDAVLQTGEELGFYYEQQREKRGQEYLDEIEARIDASPELMALNEASRAIIVMPVGAVQESENIYGTLGLYAKQDPEAREKTTVLLNVNWVDDQESDPEKKALIDKTLAEIERARQDFPEVNIATFTKVWSRDWVRDVRDNAMYGEVIKTLYDTAAFAVRRGINDGRVSADQDLLMITNDADARGMHRHYLQNYIEAGENFKESDAFVGTIRWGTDMAEKFPGYHTSQLFMQAMNVASSRLSYDTQPKTIGPNSAFRVSAYAAVGGCEDTDRSGVGADSVLGDRIVAARGGKVSNAQSTYGGALAGGGATKRESKNKIVTYRRIIGHVTGSDIDSDGERLLNKGYREGRFIPRAWDRFNSGEARNADRGNELLPPEDVTNNFPAIQSRVEQQINGFINEWYPHEKSIVFTLSMLFPDVPALKDEAQAWTLAKDSSGKFTFKFTQDGARRFRNSLLRHSPRNGQFDSISTRLKRRLYGETKRGTKRQPMPTESPLVRA